MDIIWMMLLEHISLKKNKHKTGFFVIFVLSVISSCGVSNQKLVYAIQEGETARVKAILEKDISLNGDAYDVQPLEIAIRSEHSEAISLLVSHGADPVYNNFHAIEIAVNLGNEKVIKALLDSDKVSSQTTIPSKNMTLGYWATITADEKILRVVVDGRQNCGEKHSGKTALHNVIENFDEEILQLFLLADCNPDVRDDEGVTPLGYAVIQGDKGKIRTLLGVGARVKNISVKGGYYFLGLYWRNGYESVFPYGEKDSVFQKEASSDLYIGIIYNQYLLNNEKVSLVNEFMNNGIDYTSLGKDGLRPIDHAADLGYGPSIDLLRDDQARSERIALGDQLFREFSERSNDANH